MPKYHVYSQEVVYYDSIVEASSKKEAREIVQCGAHYIGDDIFNGDYFEITNVELADDLPKEIYEISD